MKLKILNRFPFQSFLIFNIVFISLITFTFAASIANTNIDKNILNSNENHDSSSMIEFDSKSNENIKDSNIHSEKNLEMNIFDIKKNPQHLLLNEIFSIIFPKELIGIIFDYFNGNYGELYDKVIMRLRSALAIPSLPFPSLINLDYLNFQNKNFMEKIARILMRMNEVFFSDQFYCDLLRLAFKWMIQMSQSVKDEKEIKRIKKNIKSILKGQESFHLGMMKENEEEVENPFDPSSNSPSSPLSSLSSSSTSSNSMNAILIGLSKIDFNDPNFEFVTILMKYEYLERLEDIFDLFNSASMEFYNKIIDCQGLKIKYFNGDFNSDLVLKIMIYEYDFHGKMIQCFGLKNEKKETGKIKKTRKKGKRENGKVLEKENMTEKIIEKELLIEGEKIPFMIPNDISISDTSHISNYMITCFLSNNLRFKIQDLEDLYQILKKLKRMNLLSQSIIERIIEFPSSSTLTHSIPLEKLEQDQKKMTEMEMESPLIELKNDNGRKSKRRKKQFKSSLFNQYLLEMRERDPRFYKKILKLFQRREWME